MTVLLQKLPQFPLPTHEVIVKYGAPIEFEVLSNAFFFINLIGVVFHLPMGTRCYRVGTSLHGEEFNFLFDGNILMIPCSHHLSPFGKFASELKALKSVYIRLHKMQYNGFISKFPSIC